MHSTALQIVIWVAAGIVLLVLLQRRRRRKATH